MISVRGAPIISIRLHSTQGLPQKSKLNPQPKPLKPPTKLIPKVILVSSAKGGVGKSTTTVNLALSLSKFLSVGVLDADLHGPSIPKLLSTESIKPRLDDNNKLIPIKSFGLSSISIGNLVSTPIIWRGLLVQKAIKDLIFNVNWDVDLVLVDCPPGTGDILLTILQEIQTDGAIIVSTPQDVAIMDTVKGMEMFRIMKTRILGMMQNMSAFTCPCCQTTTNVFGNNGVRRKAEEMGTEFLGDIPIDVGICKAGEEGVPLGIKAPEGSSSKVYDEIARKIYDMIR